MTFNPLSLLGRRLGFYADPPLAAEDADRLRARRIGAVLALGPAMMAANLLNCAVTVLLFLHCGHDAFLVVWAAAMALFLGLWAQQWLRGRGRQRDSASARGTRRLALVSGLAAAMWAGPSLFLFADATEAQRAVLAAAQAGMMTGGAIALATVWQAAALYVLVSEAACLAAFLMHGGLAYIGLALMSLVFTAVISTVVAERGRLFARMFRANHELQDKSELIGLLLREFEANANDWLIEVTPAGQLERVSERLADAFGQPIAALEGRDVAKLLTALVETSAERAAVARLRRAFRSRQPFRNLVIPMRIAAQERLWLLSARPVFSASGAFRGFLGVGSDVTEARRAEASIRHMANFDQLTGLPNRASLHAELSGALEALHAESGGLALVAIDLDRFKHVNDTLGHGVGDRLLVEVGRRIGRELRKGDVAARFGGDEFVVLARNARERAEAETLASRLVKTLSAPYEIDGQRVLIGASAGIACAPSDGRTSEELLRNSDLALYCAKADGRGALRFFSPDMHEASQARRLLELDLREALSREELEVHFQPLVTFESDEIAAFEALARWRHPKLGFVPPSQFIPVAEETGLIVPLGAFVLRRACAAAATWSGEIAVAVNLSAIQFKSGDLVGLVRETLAEAGLAPERLELEITESILIDDKETVLQRLTQLRELGVRIALDDFGTGYSSLSYLSSFPFDKIKIDRSFVQGVAGRPESAAIIGAITALAGQLGMRTTAEGIETEVEFEWLRMAGCGEAQGFLIGAPKPEGSALALSKRAQDAPGAIRAA